MENNIGEQELQTNLEQGEPKPEEGGEITPTNEEEVFTPEQIADLKKKAEVSSQNFERAKKAEEELKKLKSEVKNTKKEKDEPSLTPKDTIALINAKIHTENFDDVVEWAKFKKIPVSEAINDKTLQTILREKDEERRTAQVTSVRGGKTLSKDSPEDIVERARKGQTTESDEDIDKLVEAQQKIKLSRLNK